MSSLGRFCDNRIIQLLLIIRLRSIIGYDYTLHAITLQVPVPSYEGTERKSLSEQYYMYHNYYGNAELDVRGERMNRIRSLRIDTLSQNG